MEIVKTNQVVAALWRDSYSDKDKGVLFQLYALNKCISHKSYSYGELSIDDLH